MGSLSLCDVFGCDLKFGLPQSKSRDLHRDRFRQFRVASRFDTVWAGQCLMRQHGLPDVEPVEPVTRNFFI